MLKRFGAKVQLGISKLLVVHANFTNDLIKRGLDACFDHRAFPCWSCGKLCRATPDKQSFRCSLCARTDAPRRMRLWVYRSLLSHCREPVDFDARFTALPRQDRLDHVCRRTDSGLAERGCGAYACNCNVSGSAHRSVCNACCVVGDGGHIRRGVVGDVLGDVGDVVGDLAAELKPDTALNTKNPATPRTPKTTTMTMIIFMVWFGFLFAKFNAPWAS